INARLRPLSAFWPGAPLILTLAIKLCCTSGLRPNGVLDKLAASAHVANHEPVDASHLILVENGHAPNSLIAFATNIKADHPPQAARARFVATTSTAPQPLNEVCYCGTGRLISTTTKMPIAQRAARMPTKPKTPRALRTFFGARSAADTTAKSSGTPTGALGLLL